MTATTAKKVRSIGVSGTRENLSMAQQHALFRLLIDQIRDGATEVHHGACVGADAFVHFHMQTQQVTTHVHPPVDDKFSAMSHLMRHNRRLDYAPKPYAERNQDIVDAADVLLAAPRWPENDPKSKRSGTWQTIHKAAAKGILVMIADNDGNTFPYEAPPKRRPVAPEAKG
jgi:hypothetical protein